MEIALFDRHRAAAIFAVLLFLGKGYVFQRAWAFSGLLGGIDFDSIPAAMRLLNSQAGRFRSLNVLPNTASSRELDRAGFDKKSGCPGKA